jgi:ascorbate-specific PTS system EIIC-type component UlaA
MIAGGMTLISGSNLIVVEATQLPKSLCIFSLSSMSCTFYFCIFSLGICCLIIISFNSEKSVKILKGFSKTENRRTDNITVIRTRAK